MTTFSFRRAFAPVVALTLSLASMARADILTYNAFPFTGSSAQAQVTFKDGVDALTPGTVDVTVSVVPNPNIGDLRGFFVNLADESLLPGLAVTGTHATQLLKVANGVDNLGGGVNSNPEGQFDVGVEIGTPGIGGDDIQTTTFTFGHNSALLTNALLTSVTDPIDPAGFNALLFAVRMTSVGPTGEPRDGSSKLGGDSNSQILGGPVSNGNGSAVPEPTSLLLWGGAAAALGWWHRSQAGRGEARPAPTR